MVGAGWEVLWAYFRWGRSGGRPKADLFLDKRLRHAPTTILFFFFSSYWLVFIKQSYHPHLLFHISAPAFGFAAVEFYLAKRLHDDEPQSIPTCVVIR